jgi:hypothetical protein
LFFFFFFFYFFIFNLGGGGGGGGLEGKKISLKNPNSFWGKKQKEETSGDDDAIGFFGLKITPN